ncbi:hypothetical protein PoB_001722700 [Plakobranchus ocellatus]|uniref:BESS domain-containing protein n=1 Tax=Plakobranchus ocellatus TaxID=259542 RepID=A0AAV3Z624_9GAST|nr:hypothetical protein PoB_001722700 [Plakobranchus ocellatus]
MSFLISYQLDRSTSGKLASETGDTQDTQDTIDSQDTQGIDFTTAYQSPTSPSPMFSISSVNTGGACSFKVSLTSRKRNIDLEILDALKALPKSVPPKTNEEDDEDYLFFKNMMPKMKCLNHI